MSNKKNIKFSLCSRHGNKNLKTVMMNIIDISFVIMGIMITSEILKIQQDKEHLYITLAYSLMKDCMFALYLLVELWHQNTYSEDKVS